MRTKEFVQHIIGGAGFVLEDITSHAEMNEIVFAHTSQFPIATRRYVLLWNYLALAFALMSSQGKGKLV